MKTGITLAQAIQTQRRLDQWKEDISIKTTEMLIVEPFMGAMTKGVPLRLGTFVQDDRRNRLMHTFTDHALSQFCSMHGFDKNRWRMVENEGVLGVRQTWKDHLNACLAHGFGCGNHSPDRLVRVNSPQESSSTGSVVRAVLSQKYASFPNARLLDRLQEASDYMDRKGVPFSVFRINQEMDRIWITMISDNREFTKDDGTGGSLYSGVQLGNSEDGSRALIVEGFLAMGFCRNGLVFRSGQSEQQQEGTLYRRHIGSIEILQHKFNLAIAEAFQMSDTMMERFLGLRDRTVENPLDEITRIVNARRKKQGFSESFLEQVKGAYPIYQQNFGDNMFSVINAFTQAAQALGDDDQVAVEREMGSLVSGLAGNPSVE